MNDDTLIEKVNKLLNELASTNAAASADLFSGTVLVAHHQQPILTAACGYALHPNIQSNRVDTKFNIASVTKMLTAVAVMRLVAEGKLDLHVPVVTYRPDLPHASEITIHKLLTLPLDLTATGTMPIAPRVRNCGRSTIISSCLLQNRFCFRRERATIMATPAT